MSTNIHPTDPDVKVPAGVRAASERADAHFRERYGKKDEPKLDSKSGEEQIGEPVPSKGQEPQPEAKQSEPENKPDTQPTPSGNEADWENRYNSMRGRFEQESRARRELNEKVNNLERVISSLQSQPAPHNGAKPAEAEQKARKLITEDEEREYGTEFIDLVGRRAREVAAEMVGPYEAKIADLEKRLGNVGATVTADARSKMFQHLENSVPNWQALNRDQRFMDWLGLPDRFSGVIRQRLLDSAFEQNNAPRVAEFFKGFLAEEAAPAPAESGAAPAAPAKQAAGKVPLETLAAPGRAKSSAASSTPDEKPIINRADIVAFYADVNAGKYRGNEKKKEQFEQELFEAQRDGRIR